MILPTRHLCLDDWDLVFFSKSSAASADIVGVWNMPFPLFALKLQLNILLVIY